jgi:adenylate cyclase
VKSAPLTNVLIRVHLLFKDEQLERDFSIARVAANSKVVSIAVGATAVLWALFSVWDATSGQGVDQTRFRFMVAIPVLLVFLALSFTRLAQQYQSAFVICFATFASVLAVKQLQQYGDGPYSLAGGSSALNFALILVFGIGIFPISVLSSVLVGALVISVYVFAILVLTTTDIMISGSYFFNLVCIHGVLVFMSYWRERFARQEYVRRINQDRERQKLATYLSSYIPLEMVELPSNADHPAESFGEVTLLFCDLVGFTSLAEQLAPKHLLEVLDAIFTAFDCAADRHGVEKVKTIGDGYMAIAGKISDATNHAKAMIEFALDAVSIVAEVAGKTGYPLRVRIGAHTGSTIGGVIGRRKMLYDYWGRTVNIASRLESASEPNRIHISESTYWRVRDFYTFEERQGVELRGVGSFRSFFVKGRTDSAPRSV